MESDASRPDELQGLKSRQVDFTLGVVERNRDVSMTLELPAESLAKVFAQILDGTVACLAAGSMEVPQDELHQEILLPLLPAMLADGVIRQYWQSQTTVGFFPALRTHLEVGAARPKWTAGDFEVHVAASYAAGPDAKALADTLLSEEGLRDLTAGLMNQALESAWPTVSQPVEPLTADALSEKPVAEPVEAAEVAVEQISASPEQPDGWMPLIRPQPWQTARNPLAGAAKTGAISGSDWTKSNPMDRREGGYK